MIIFNDKTIFTTVNTIFRPSLMKWLMPVNPFRCHKFWMQ